MGISTHVELFMKGSRVWNSWHAEKRAASADFEADLSHAELFLANPASLQGIDLRNANLQGANLSSSDLTGADFRGANLDETVIQRATFAETHLERALIRRAKLFKTDLSGANLTEADCCASDLRATILHGAIFDRTALSEVDFSAAEMHRTKFLDVNLGEAKGLESAFHSAPSTLGVDTLVRSGSRIPMRFLSGAGIPEEIIAYKHPPRPEGPYPSCFISHSSKDETFSDRLQTDLKARGVPCWFNELDGGLHLMDQIDDAIQRHEKVLLILSANSIESPWVQTEIYKAREREKRERIRVLFPIRIDPFELISNWKCAPVFVSGDLAQHVRDYYIPDFSKWTDPPSYQRAFEKLLISLARSRELQRRAS